MTSFNIDVRSSVINQILESINVVSSEIRVLYTTNTFSPEDYRFAFGWIFRHVVRFIIEPTRVLLSERNGRLTGDDLSSLRIAIALFRETLNDFSVSFRNTEWFSNGNRNSMFTLLSDLTSLLEVFEDSAGVSVSPTQE